MKRQGKVELNPVGRTNWKGNNDSLIDAGLQILELY